MISKISGILEEYSVVSGWISIATASGVSYKVSYIAESIAPALGSNVDVFTTVIFREDNQTIWGFNYACERNVFELLLSVNGVGGKSAQLLIAKLGVSDLVEYINRQAYSELKVPGVGEKTAKKIVLELHTKADILHSFIKSDNKFINDKADKITLLSHMGGAGDKIKNEIIEALVSLGYAEKKAREILVNEDLSEKTIEQGLRDALRRLKDN